MSKRAQFHAVPVADGYNLKLVAANGEVLWNDRQGRPKANLRRDLARIKRAAEVAYLVIDDPPEA